MEAQLEKLSDLELMKLLHNLEEDCYSTSDPEIRKDLSYKRKMVALQRMIRKGKPEEEARQLLNLN